MTMSLLDSYLNAVRVYLPRDADHQDILKELSTHLQITLEDKEQELGRPLSDDEQAAVLTNYGSPLVVAGRYGSTNLGLSFGRQLIGPEAFVLYRRLLALQFVLIVVVVSILRWLGAAEGNLFMRYLGPMLIQFALMTAIFMAVDALQRRARARASWSFPPPHMQPIPRWQSVGGFVTLSTFALWWSLIPVAPFLLLGPLASRVEFTASWHAFYWPVLAPLLIGAAQRLVTLADPGRILLQSLTRLFTNLWAVALLYPFLLAYPYVVAIPGSGAETAAGRINSTLWWNSMASLGLYWLINAGFVGVVAVKHISVMMRRRQAAQQAVR
jgi:hypothetical protein